MNTTQALPRLVLFIFTLGTALLLERCFPLRQATQPKLPRLIKNLFLGAIASVALKWMVFPVVFTVSTWATIHRVGLFHQLPLPNVLRIALSLVALDYLLYIWHRMNHRIPFLWRFHNTHHVDLDLDVSTGLRFHFGELAISAVYRSLEILALGIDPFTLVLYETTTTLFVEFHHSNIRLPLRIERVLNRIWVTPRMHGIHHSIVRSETDSNYSTIFSFWDRLHQTLRLGIEQNEIIIGVPSYQNPNDVTFFKVLTMPFQAAREWRLSNGKVPLRSHRVHGRSQA